MRYVSLVFFIIITVSCSRNKVSVATIKNRVDTINATMSIGHPDTAYVTQTLKMIGQYHRDEKPDTNLAKSELHMVVILEALGKNRQSVGLCKNIQANYPNTKFAAEACWREGFLYANSLGEYDKAKEKYNEYLQKNSDKDINIDRKSV